MTKHIENFFEWWDEKREWVGFSVLGFGGTCIILEIEISATQLGVLFLGCLMFIGKQHFEGVSAGPVGVSAGPVSVNHEQ